MGALDQLLGLLCRHARQADAQFDFNAEALRNLTDTDHPLNRRISRHGQLVAACDKLHRTNETGRIACSKQLLRVGALTTCAAQLPWRSQFDIQYTVGGNGTTVTATGSFCRSAIDNLFNGHKESPVMKI